MYENTEAATPPPCVPCAVTAFEQVLLDECMAEQSALISAL